MASLRGAWTGRENGHDPMDDGGLSGPCLKLSVPKTTEWDLNTELLSSLAVGLEQ